MRTFKTFIQSPVKYRSRAMIAVFRVDSSPAIGAGHLMRCFSLASRMNKNGFQPAFLMFHASAKDHDMVRSLGFLHHAILGDCAGPSDAEQTLRFAAAHHAACIVLDGYQFRGDYVERIAQRGYVAALIDDFGELKRYPVDLVINQNMHAKKAMYTRKRGGHASFLLGSQYALLRDEFSKNKIRPKQRSFKAKHLLITLGSSDPKNVTLKVLRVLDRQRFENLAIRVVIGRNNVHKKEIGRFLKTSRAPVKVFYDTSRMAPLMRWADLAISAGGTTGLELACMGLPSLIIILAQNQACLARELKRNGAAAVLGWHHQLSPGKITSGIERLLNDPVALKRMSRRGRKLIDGKGAERVAQALANLCIAFTPAGMSDRVRVFRWANDPLARKVSFHSKRILWSEHKRWFAKIVGSESHQLWIAHWNGKPVGQVRFEKKDRYATISVSLDPLFRGRGLGSRLICLATERFISMNNIRNVRALVKRGNSASFFAFRSAGYQFVSKTKVCGHDAVSMRYAQ